MITRALLSALEHAQNPRMIRAISRGLEVATGLSVKDVLATFSTSEDIRKYYAIYPGITGALGSYSSHTGISVTQDRALESSAVYACVKIISEDLGAMPFNLFQRTSDKTVERAVKHSLYPVLHDAANPDLGSGEWVEMMTAHAALGCDGFSRIVRDNGGNVVALWPLMPSQVRVSAKTGQPTSYEVLEENKWIPYSREKIFHLRGFTLNGQRGDDILQRARHVLGLTLATQEYAGRFFSNDTSIGVILERPVGAPGLGVEQVKAIKEAWKAWHQGISLAHEPAILQEGMTAKRLEPDHEKLQMIEQRKFQVVEVCRLWRMPPHKLADLDRATFSNVEQQSLEYVTNTLHPWLNRWKQAVYRCLLKPEERSTYFAEHNVESLLRGDFKTQTDGFRALLEKGVYSINEVRAWFNLNPVEGGDEHRVQVNTQSVAEVAKSLVIEMVKHMGVYQAADSITQK